MDVWIFRRGAVYALTSLLAAVLTSLLAVALILLLAACGGGGGSSGTVNPPPPPPTPVDQSFPGTPVIKVRAIAGEWVALTEKLAPVTVRAPDRRLRIALDAGRTGGTFAPADGYSLIDFALHPSGQVTLALAQGKTAKLVRLDAQARVIVEMPFVDPATATDPFIGPSTEPRDDTSLLSMITLDTIRVAPIGEDVAVAIHSGRNAVVAYRMNYGATNGFTRAWRTLVEPGVDMGERGITSGTFDTFGQLIAHFRVFLDSDAQGNLALAVEQSGFGDVAAGHAAQFSESFTFAHLSGVIVSRLDANGVRQRSTGIDTNQTSELHGLRLIDGRIALVGRVFTVRRDDGTGWDAFAAFVDRASGAVLSYRVIDVDRGEVLFDIAPLADGRYLAGGTAGYDQNPVGASVSPDSGPLLAILETDGSLRRRVPYPAGPRQTQIRGFARWNDNWLLGGMLNGPGTHSADGNPALLTGDGFVKESASPAP